MARYEYKCNTCGSQYEIERPMGHSQYPQPMCCEVPMVRVYSAPSIQFKGTGWASKE